MLDELRSRFQDIWLVAGGATLAVIGTCAMVSLCAAMGLIWLFSPSSSSEERTTQTDVAQQATIDSPTQQTPLIFPTESAGIPTLLPIPNTSGRLPTTTSPLITPLSAPDQAVRTYYDLVSQQRYDQTWPMLTDTFKQKFNCCAPNYNYTGYVGWWDSVDRVDFGNVQTVSQNGDQAVVYAEIYYIMNNGNRSAMVNTPYIALSYDSAAGSWQFNDMRAFP